MYFRIILDDRVVKRMMEGVNDIRMKTMAKLLLLYSAKTAAAAGDTLHGICTVMPSRHDACFVDPFIVRGSRHA